MLLQLGLLFVVLFCLTYGRMATGLFVALCLTLSVLVWAVRRGHPHRHGAFLSIDQRAHQSRMAPWHTGGKLALAVLAVAGCVAAGTPAVPAYLLLTMSLLTVLAGGTPVRYYLSLLAVPMAFILLSCLAIVVEVSPVPLGVLWVPVGGWYLCITPASQAAAWLAALRALGAVSCLYLLSLSTPIYRVVEALRRMGVPAVVIELMYLMYRYLFILLEVHQNMVHAAASRLGYRSYRTTMRTMLRHALALLFISLRRTSGMLQAMEARCYDGQIRFLHQTRPLGGMQVLLSGAVLGGMVLVWTLSQGGLL